MYNDFHEDYLMHYEKGQRAKDAKYSKIHISKNGKPWYEYPRSYYNTVKSFANNFGKNMGKTVTNFKNSKEAKNVVNKFKKATESASKAVKDMDIKKTGKDVLDKATKVAKSTGDSLKKTGKDSLEKAKKVAANTKKKVEDATGITAKKNLVGNQTKFKLSQKEFNTHSTNSANAKKEAEEKKTEIKKLTNVGEIDDGREAIKKLLERSKQSSKAASYELGRMKDLAKKITANKKEYDNSLAGKAEKAMSDIKKIGNNLFKSLKSAVVKDPKIKEADDIANKLIKTIDKDRKERNLTSFKNMKKEDMDPVEVYLGEFLGIDDRKLSKDQIKEIQKKFDDNYFNKNALEKKIDSAKDSLVEKGKEVKAKIDQEKWYKENSGKVGLNSYEDIKKTGKLAMNAGNTHVVIIPSKDKLESFDKEAYASGQSEIYDMTTALKFMSDIRDEYQKADNKLEYLEKIKGTFGENSLDKTTMAMLVTSDDDFAKLVAGAVAGDNADVQVVKKGDNIFIEVKEK